MGQQKKPRTQYVFEVVGTEAVSPQLMRVWFSCSDFDGFAAAAAERASTDAYVKIQFARPELGLTPPYDLDELRGRLAPEDMPSRRTYTVRRLDHEARRIAIDFVVHGDTGVAGPWAARAVAGDKVSASGPGGKYAPSPDVAEHLFIGDESALPAIASAIETLPADAVGTALIEVESARDEVALDGPTGLRIRWVHRAQQPHGSALVAAVEELPTPTEVVDVFAHGERASMKRLRAVIHDTWGIPRERLSISAYWAAGRAEDAFQAEKREPVGQIFESDQLPPAA